MITKHQSDYIQSLAKGLAVIRAFNNERPCMTLSEASRETALPRAGVRRIMLTLKALGYMREDRHRRWHLTPRVLELGFSYLSSIDISEMAYPYMQEVSDRTGEACSITVLDESDSVYVARVPANRVMSVTLGVGSRLPAWLTSHGRILLSDMDDATLERYLHNQPRKPYTALTVWEVLPLMKIIRKVQESGYCLVKEELEEGLMALAVPIYDRYGKVQASLHISTHCSRATEKKTLQLFLPVLKDAAEKIKVAIS